MHAPKVFHESKGLLSYVKDHFGQFVSRKKHYFLVFQVNLDSQDQVAPASWPRRGLFDLLKGVYIAKEFNLLKHSLNKFDL